MIDMRRAAAFPLARSEGDTIWMGAIDRDGLAVSYIQSLYWEWGSGCVLPRTGIHWQNRGASFALDPGAANPLEPGRKPFHTLIPALAAFADGRVMAYGAMGGDGQPQFQAQIFSRYRGGMGVADAVDAPRWLLGRTWGQTSTTLKMESRFDAEIMEGLARLGHDVEELGAALFRDLRPRRHAGEAPAATAASRRRTTRAPTAAPRGCDVIPGLREAKSPEPITTAMGKRGSTPAPRLWVPGSRLRRAPE